MEQLSFYDVERWLPVPGWEGLYEASDQGRVRSVRRFGTKGGVLSAQSGEFGHLTVCLWDNGTRKARYVHQLVMLAFVGPRPDGMEVRHLDGNPANNRWTPGTTEQEIREAGGNLIYGTHAENECDKLRHGTHNNAKKTHCKWGHEYTPENTGVPSGRPTHRFCLTCRRERWKKGRSADDLAVA